MKISDKGRLNYCPCCGESTDKEWKKVGRYKENLFVECPEHGELWVGGY